MEAKTKMDRKKILEDMKNSVGTKNPIEFFKQFVDIFNLLFDELDSVNDKLNKIKIQSALAIKWEPRLASMLLSNQIEILRADKETYHEVLSEFKKAYAEDVITQSYDVFCVFWQEQLGYHPFLEYK